MHAHGLGMFSLLPLRFLLEMTDKFANLISNVRTYGVV